LAAYKPAANKPQGFEAYPGDYLSTRPTCKGGPAIVKLLLDQGANVNTATVEDEMTALDAAVYGENFAVVRLLEQREQEKQGTALAAVRTRHAKIK
jgi:ankyrin repeat protein